MKKEVLTEHKAEQFLKKYLPIAKSMLTRNLDHALEFSRKLGDDVVLKIMSSQALHKTDVGGVKIAKNIVEIKEGYGRLSDIAKTKKLKLDGILVQEFVEGKQLIIGIKKDPTFGHVIMFGLGGIFVEVMKDVSFRMCPITLDDAQSMIDELKSSKLLYGARGEKPVNIGQLKKILVKTSQIPSKHKNIEELDINPLIINDKLAKVADARIVLG